MIYNIILNVIIGFIFGVIIGFLFISKHQYKGPSSTKIKNIIYIDKMGSKFRYVPHVHICPIIVSMKNK